MNLHIPDVRILEVHPAPWSNLRNTCQPSSLPEERNVLGLPLLLHAVADAAKLGYNFLNVGGEEPLRYPWLAALCREAHKHGMLTSMITRSASLTAAAAGVAAFLDRPAGRGDRGQGRAAESPGKRDARSADHGAAADGGARFGDSVRDRLLSELRPISGNWNGRRISPRHTGPQCCRCGRRRTSPTKRWRRRGC